MLLSARRVGPSGVAYGVDMTDEMLTLARANAAKAGAANVEFVKGEIEALPLPAASVDVVISNCVINLSTDKPAVLAEMFRVLVPGGRIGVTDVVAEDHLTAADRAAAGSYAGCIAGALSRTEYLDGLAAAGFTDVSVTFTHEAAPGMHSAIIRAVRPATDNRGPGTATGHRLASWPGPAGTGESLPDHGQAHGAIRRKVRVPRSPMPAPSAAAAQAGGQVRKQPPGAVPGARRDRLAGPGRRRSCPGRQPAPGRGWTSAPLWPRRVPHELGRTR